MIRAIIILITTIAASFEILDMNIMKQVPEADGFFENLTKKKCKSCKCYLIDCSILKQPDIDCEDKYTENCESKSYIVEEDDCEQVCDCCIGGVCMMWKDYYCFVLRAYQFLSVLYFLIIIIEFFSILGLFKYFFSINRQWSLYDNTVDWEGDPKVLTLHYTYTLFIQYKHDYDKKVSFHPGYPKTRVLLDDIFKEANVAWRNWYLFVLVILLFLTVTGLTIFSIIDLPKSPVAFSFLFWILNISAVLVILLTLFGFFFVRPYREVVHTKVLEFEKSFRCKVQILNDFRIIQFKFRKETLVFAQNFEESVPTLNDIKVVGDPAEDSADQDQFDSSQFIDVSRSMIKEE